MAGFDTKERNNRGEYEITFYTEDYIQFKKVENLCRELIGHAKPIMPQHDNLKDKLFDEAVEELARANQSTATTDPLDNMPMILDETAEKIRTGKEHEE